MPSKKTRIEETKKGNIPPKTIPKKNQNAEVISLKTNSSIPQKKKDSETTSNNITPPPSQSSVKSEEKGSRKFLIA